MFRWLRRQPDPPLLREALLQAIPIKNDLVRETRAGTALHLTGPARTGWRQLFGAHSQKTFELDELGASVWDALNGRRTVEDAIRRFADEHRVNLREAEVAVLAFLKTLLQRGLIAMVAQKPPPKPRRRRK